MWSRWEYSHFGAAMMKSHARNYGTENNSVEPSLEEIREMMFGGKLTIAPHNGELLEEMRHYRRDENFKIVKSRDDLVSAMRYAIMMRRSGRALKECDGVGFGDAYYAHQRRGSPGGGGPQVAEGTDFDWF